MCVLALVTLRRCFKVTPQTLMCPIQHRKLSLPTSPKLAVGLLLRKGVKFKLKAFLMNSLRTREPPQPVTSWKRCRVQQLLRWSTETAELPSAPRQLQQASPRLCKLLSESITHLSLFWARCNFPLFLFFFFSLLHPYKKKTEEHSDAIFAVKCCGGSWLQAESKYAPVPRGERGAGGSAATRGPMENKDRGTAQDQKDTACDLREGNVCHSQEQRGNTERGRLPTTQLP